MERSSERNSDGNVPMEDDDEDANMGLFIIIAALAMPLFNALFYGNELFRFRTIKDYYKAGLLGTTGNTNWWELANIIYLWGNMIIWSALFIVNVLSMFIEASIMAIWLLVVLGLPALSMCYGILAYIAYEDTYAL